MAFPPAAVSGEGLPVGAVLLAGVMFRDLAALLGEGREIGGEVGDVLGEVAGRRVAGVGELDQLIGVRRDGLVVHRRAEELVVPQDQAAADAIGNTAHSLLHDWFSLSRQP